MSDGEANKAILRRWIDGLNAREYDAIIDELIAPDYIQHGRWPGFPQGREGVKQLFRSFAVIFPDMHLALEDLFGEGDRVLTRCTVRATHAGEMLGIPATNRRVIFQSVDIWRVQDGLMREHWDEVDRLSMLQQVGAVPLFAGQHLPPAED